MRIRFEEMKISSQIYQIDIFTKYINILSESIHNFVDRIVTEKFPANAKRAL